MSDDRSVRVLLVDEWAVAAEQLRRDLSALDGVCVVGVARSAEEAARMSVDLHADVAAVDVGVRGGNNALTIPVVAVAGHDRAAVSAGLYAVEGGAVDLWVRSDDVDDLADRLTAAAAAHPDRPDLATTGRRATGSAAGSLLVLGAGVGGTASLGLVIAGLPADAAGVVVTSLPAAAVAVWARRVGRRTPLAIAVADGVHPVAAGRLWVAPGDRHLTVRPAPGGGLAVVARDGPRVGGRKPSLDVTLSSAADCGSAVVAAVLGGGGTDGVGGLTAVREAGGRTAAESAETAVCGELPATALRVGAAEDSAPAGELASLLARMAGGHRSNRAA